MELKKAFNNEDSTPSHSIYKAKRVSLKWPIAMPNQNQAAPRSSIKPAEIKKVAQQVSFKTNESTLLQKRKTKLQINCALKRDESKETIEMSRGSL